MQKADVAMSRAKEQGKSTYRLYTESMNEKAHERLALENDLRRALERDELELYYQPKVDTDSGRIGSCEALARWNHPQLGFIGPSRFIPIAEETGLIVPLGEWVLRQACIQNLEWQKKGMSPLRVAVNLSPRQFLQHDLLDMIARVLKNVGMSPQCLELEVTENVMIQNIAQTAAILRRLHDLGIQISIDDFGTGYSSLSYLKRFPIHALKIDRSFVSDITWNQDDAAIASAVITMAHSLKLGVIAEGVETKEQLKFLQDLQCHNMQGNFFSKPVPANEFYGLLKEGQAPVMM
jgi:EAL domain-containing protein (putative c-di-GMP-specific phosphodiesterase class I)